MPDHEEVIVRVGNKLEDASEEVRATLEGVAALSAGLIAIGERGFITPGNELRGFEELIGRISMSLSNQRTADRFNDRHGDSLDEHFEAAVNGLGSSAFKGYVWELGAMDTLYTLAPTDATKENELTLTVVGRD